MYLMLVVFGGFVGGASVGHSQTVYDFEWDNLLLAAAKSDEHFDYSANTNWYMEKYRPDVWRYARNDEFTLQEKRGETEKIFREKVAQFDLDQKFVLRSSLNLGDYDFETEMFPIKGVNSGYHWLDHSYKNGNFPRTYSAHPTNIEVLNQLPMSKAIAKSFVNGRKDRYGRVDRRVYVKFTIKLGKMRDRSSFECEIQEGGFYADRSYTQPIGGGFKKAELESSSKANQPSLASQ
jgi:hypothetical protein